MNDENKLRILSQVITTTELLLNQSTILCEVLNYSTEAESISTRISTINEEIDQRILDMSVVGYNNTIANDEKASILFDICNQILHLSRNVGIVAKSFVRFNITDIKEEVAFPLVDFEKSFSLLMEIFVSIRNDENVNLCLDKVFELRQIYIRNSNGYDAVMKKLFNSDESVIDIVRWKDIYASVNRVYVGISDMIVFIMKYLMFGE
ncbi:MAG: hypothetical protein MJ153_00160 [Clostridia bacterium]|nr:hypothetical protein [Clostridia bacterium]